MNRSLLAITGAFIALSSCRPQEFVPKPTGYFRVDTFASHEYRVFDEPDFPYTFEYPVYAKIERDTVYYSEKARNPYWINIAIAPPVNGVINITYLPVSSEDAFEKMVNDAYGLSAFHEKRADYIREQNYTNSFGVSGIVYTVGGNAASRVQFTATDGARHFMRGALYFDVTPNADSLKPGADFLAQDINHMLATLRFR